MAGVFHERQEGQLCAQHALNALLQGPYFTAVDLAEIAQVGTVCVAGHVGGAEASQNTDPTVRWVVPGRSWMSWSASAWPRGAWTRPSTAAFCRYPPSSERASEKKENDDDGRWGRKTEQLKKQRQKEETNTEQPIPGTKGGKIR